MFSKLILVASFVAFTAGQFQLHSGFLAPLARRPAIIPFPQPTVRAFVPVPAPVPAAYRQTGEASARVLKLDNIVNPDGSYQYAYETDNGISAHESGVPQPHGKDLAEQVQGGFSYTSPEGEHVVIQYVANENGFQPTGSHIPTPPPIPAAIARSLQFLGANGRL